MFVTPSEQRWNSVNTEYITIVFHSFPQPPWYDVHIHFSQRGAVRITRLLTDTESVLVGRGLQKLSSSTPCSERGQVDQVAQGCAQLSSEHLQGRMLHPVPGFDHPRGKQPNKGNYYMNFQFFSLQRVCYLWSCHCALWAVWLSLLYTLPFGGSGQLWDLLSVSLPGSTSRPPSPPSPHRTTAPAPDLLALCLLNSLQGSKVSYWEAENWTQDSGYSIKSAEERANITSLDLSS